MTRIAEQLAGLRHGIKRIVEHLLGVRFYLKLPHGHEECDDIRRTGHEVKTILDIGANIGQSARQFHESFPESAIYCFEPVSDTFRRLQSNVKSIGAKCYRLAMGATPGKATIYLTGQSLTHTLIAPKQYSGKEEVEIVTVDSFAGEQGMEHIDLLKIDTEGFDLEVLRGASAMLARGGVSFVLVEVGFHPGDRRHVLVDDVRSTLMANGFYLFGFYGQTLEWSGERR